MATRSDKGPTIFKGISEVQADRLLTEHSAIDPHKCSIVFLEALGRLDRELKKAGLTNDKPIHITVAAETIVET